MGSQVINTNHKGTSRVAPKWSEIPLEMKASSCGVLLVIEIVREEQEVTNRLLKNAKRRSN
jgi:hypothetical protein